MTVPIGYQDGITAFIKWLRQQPGVPPRGPNYNPADMATWPWPDKLERTLRILKDDHDAAVVPPPPPPPPPVGPRLAPMTHYAAPGADARFCVRSPGVTELGPDDFVDEGGFRYSENGMCRGGRSGKFVAMLKPANSMDGKEPCDGYVKDGRTFPPWPPESYEV